MALGGGHESDHWGVVGGGLKCCAVCGAMDCMPAAYLTSKTRCCAPHAGQSVPRIQHVSGVGEWARVGAAWRWGYLGRLPGKQANGAGCKEQGS